MQYFDRLITTLMLLTMVVNPLISQAPFDCNGRIYRVVEKQGGTSFQEISINYEEQDIEFSDLAFFRAKKINGIGYRTTDNLIYGVILGKDYELCIIDSNYELFTIKPLPLPNDLLFVSGDISPNDRFLVLLGFSPNEPGNLLALVDLESPDYQTRLIPVAIQGDVTSVKCADIAFHPTSKQLFGYDHAQRRIISIDINNRNIDANSFPTNDVVSGNVPCLFFDAFGTLMGIGNELEVFSNRSWFQFNLEDGSVSVIDELNFEGNQDGCSCPYRVNLLNRIQPNTWYPCTTAQITLTIINRSPFEQEGVKLRDTLPDGVFIQNINNPTYIGKQISGIGSHILAIDDMRIPVGQDSIVLEVEIGENIQPGIFFNQAHLKNINATYDQTPINILSDNPTTLGINDPTTILIKALEVDFSHISNILCPNDTLLLNPEIIGARTYTWSDGTTRPTLPITTPGVYGLTVETDCAQTSGNITIIPSDFAMTLGEDRLLEKGNQAQLTPQIQSNYPISYYYWTSSEPTSIDCYTCSQTIVDPLSEITSYQLQIEDSLGCEQIDQINIRRIDFEVYAPNVFSPNGDGIHDTFFISSRNPQKIESLRIFDRWGNLIWQTTNQITNQPEVGWNGKTLNNPVSPGIYIWQIAIQQNNQSTYIQSGDFLLIR